MRSPRAHAPRAWQRRLDAAAAALRRIIGAPDYEHYAAHMRACHPGQRVLSRDEFARQRLEDRYARPGARCC
jgi:uncharacterized short protein YbdD (DUF466 family)